MKKRHHPFIFLASALAGALIVILTIPSNPLTPENILASAEQAGEYLVDAVKKNGEFIYQYDPVEDTVSSEYNILRHAGTTYSMLELYEVTQDPATLEAAENALHYLENQIEPCKSSLEGTLCLIEKGYVKLGGNGLAIVAMAKHMTVTNDPKYLETMQSLAKWIQATQSKEGEFLHHKQSQPEGETTDFISGYYPGEALLALARLYQLDNNEDWINTAEKGATWLITVRDKDLSENKISHDHWLLYALNEIYRYRPDEIFLEHSFKIADAIMDSQRKTRSKQNPEWLGSYYSPPRSTPTATRSEGLLSTYNLAKDFGTTEKAEEILKSIELGIVFQLQTQFKKGEKILKTFRNSDRVIGAFREGIDVYTIRIDYVQHNISSLIGYLKIIQTSK